MILRIVISRVLEELVATDDRFGIVTNRDVPPAFEHTGIRFLRIGLQQPPLRLELAYSGFR